MGAHGPSLQKITILTYVATVTKRIDGGILFWAIAMSSHTICSPSVCKLACWCPLKRKCSEGKFPCNSLPNLSICYHILLQVAWKQHTWPAHHQTACSVGRPAAWYFEPLCLCSLSASVNQMSASNLGLAQREKQKSNRATISNRNAEGETLQLCQGTWLGEEFLGSTMQREAVRSGRSGRTSRWSNRAKQRQRIHSDLKNSIVTIIATNNQLTELQYGMSTP